MMTTRHIKGLIAIFLALNSASASLLRESAFEIGITYRPEDYYEALRIGASFAHFPWDRAGYMVEWETGYWSDEKSAPVPSDWDIYSVNAWRAGSLFTVFNHPLQRNDQAALRIDVTAGASYVSWNLQDSDAPNRRRGGAFVGVQPKIWSQKKKGKFFGGDFILEQSPAGWNPDIKIRIGYRF